ncbi:LysR family transcriptional regulator [Paraburkholderia fungorum]|jgi:DNA-binding transcriptional LysR family regulator|uniref:DNA-binding transcriptional LysR family regulator n=1 Tax=Paraburkholderia fungorum TaxID=134537 RepID=A0AAP1PM63_9BURK|nr:LysR substrate-binding domain-containing protein [Paraburkholderia fungorum]MBB4515268.1 DNA-binding transcriptional LysR family regulator [Paraburkholderia fungorum]MBB6203211.1 DNA-binding transcriptional LysR family regulator [Paraburkholderia fungorum]MDT8836028.1 LysR substrate-binding domain-containing protein [Paraburkholderia fungorum]PRZ56690.1 DNA-binding transcriptional LysR family regulator [Paraburkholderia fungorum]
MSTLSRPLDLDAIQAFVLVADLGSFTRAAEVMDTSQAAMSLKLKRLEERLGYRLLERTPRVVRLSPRGDVFIGAARQLLLAHERALAGSAADTPERRLKLGISDHVAGPNLPALLGRLAAYDPLLVIEVRIAASRDVLAWFDRGEVDAAIGRREGDRSDGQLLAEERLGWFAAPGWQHREGQPLRLATLAAPCGIRAIATDALDTAGIAWTEVFVGGGVMAVGAAVSAGLAVAALAQRVAPAGAIEVGEQLGLPPLPTSKVVLHTRLSDPRSQETLRAVSSAFLNAAY